MRILAKVYHVVYGHGDRGIDSGHDENAKEVEDCRHDNGFSDADRLCGDTGSNGIGGICPTVDQYDAQRQNGGDEQHGIAQHLTDKFKHIHK